MAKQLLSSPRFLALAVLHERALGKRIARVIDRTPKRGLATTKADQHYQGRGIHRSLPQQIRRQAGRNRREVEFFSFSGKPGVARMIEGPDLISTLALPGRKQLTTDSKKEHRMRYALCDSVELRIARLGRRVGLRTQSGLETLRGLGQPDEGSSMHLSFPRADNANNSKRRFPEALRGGGRTS